MRLRAVFLLALILTDVVASAPQKAPAVTGSLVIKDITVIDGSGHLPQPDMAVVISNGRIAAIGKAQDIHVPGGATVVSRPGNFVLPGFWNMHLHAVGYEEAKQALPILLAHGITGVRDMGSPIADVLRLRQEIQDGSLLGPRLVVCGPLVEGPIPIKMPLLMPVNGREEARSAVRLLRQKGVDFVKIDDSVPRSLYLVIMDEAKRAKLPVAGHLPPTVSASEAAKAGQVSVEHMGGTFLGILVACSRRESKLQKERNAIYREALAALERKQKPEQRQLRVGFTNVLLDTYDPMRADALFRLFARNNVWQCPTLVVLRTLWESNRAEQNLTDEDVANGQKIFKKYQEMVRAMREAGVEFLAGTDGPYAPGASGLHEELALLVEAGFSPMGAIQAATRNAAVFLGLSRDYGTVEVGKVADLVLLDADPLADIRNSRRVAAVILGGRFYSEKAPLRPRK